jgi:hypothetical protein
MSSRTKDKLGTLNEVCVTFICLRSRSGLVWRTRERGLIRFDDTTLMGESEDVVTYAVCPCTAEGEEKVRFELRPGDGVPQGRVRTADDRKPTAPRAWRADVDPREGV